MVTLYAIWVAFVSLTPADFSSAPQCDQSMRSGTIKVCKIGDFDTQQTCIAHGEQFTTIMGTQVVCRAQ